MSLVRLNIKSRIELETRVLAAALKQSFERQDAQGVSLAHRQLFLLLKDAGRSDESGVATVHFSDGVPPGLPVAPGADAASASEVQAPVVDDAPIEPVYAGNIEPAGADEQSSVMAAIDPFFSLPVDDRAHPTAGGSGQQSSRSWPQRPSGSEDEPASSISDNGETSDIAATAEPGSLAARLYAEPLFGEHKATMPPGQGKEQKTTLDRLPAARVSSDANIEDSSIGELDDRQAGDQTDEDSRHQATPLEEHNEQTASALVEKALKSSEHPREEDDSDLFGPADEYFHPQPPPAALTPEAAMAQLAQLGYGSSSTYKVPNFADDAGETGNEAFSRPGGIVDAHFVVSEETAPPDEESNAPQSAQPAAPDVVPPPKHDESELETFAPEPEKHTRAAPNAFDLLVEPAARAARAGKSTAAAKDSESAAPKHLDVYMILGVSQMSPFDEIHRNFLRKVRKLLREIKGNKAERYPKLAELQRLWIAHDILTDPVTRTDYDFRDMGLRGVPDAIMPHAPEDQQQARLHNRTPLRIGELLQCAGLLETAELEIACDMHKAMPEMQFGTFLVRQGFIQERDLESVLLGQRLLKDGAITVAQFQVAMELSQSRGTGIRETLVEKNYISALDLESLVNDSSEEMPAPPVVQIREISVVPKSENDNFARKAPTWRDQLDWGSADSDKNEDDQAVSGGLGGLLRAQAPAPPKSEGSAVERVMKITKPESPSPAEAKKASLDIKHAVPSWTDQLDWDTVESQKEEPPAVSTEAAESSLSEPSGRPALRLSNAVPTWKDQLDWSSPSEGDDASMGAESVGVSTSENQPLEVDKELEFAPGEETSQGLREAAQQTAKDHQAVDLDMHRPIRVKGETTTYEELPTVDLGMTAASIIDSGSDAETANFPTSVASAVRASASTPAEGVPEEAEEEEDTSAQSKRDKKKRGKDKRKKKR
ncbi:MAG TPA: hypothetical protein V6C81_15620 [Planktothrix sp.]|jgi:hypothetical protein